MKRLLLAFATSAALMTAAAPATAADIIVAPSVSAIPVFNWSGFYIGLHGGYDWKHADVHLPAYVGGAGLVAGPDSRPSSWLFGAQMGFNVQFAGGFVAGAEVDFTFLNGRASAFSGTLFAQPERIHVETSSTSSVRARLGYAFDRTLVYVTGGVASMSYDVYATLGGNVSTSRVGVTPAGWIVGIGAEYALNNALSLRAEYLYSNFDRTRITLGTDVDTRLDNHVFRIGLNFAVFAPPPSAAPISARF